MSRYTNVIWDWNGTLLDDVDVCLEIVNEMLAERSVPSLTRCRYRDIFDVPVCLYWERAGIDLKRVDFNEISVEFCTRFERRLHRASLFSAVQPVMKDIRRMGKRHFLLSNTEQRSLERMVRDYGLDGLFDSVRGMPNTLAEGKLGAGRLLMDQFNLDCGSTLVVGDTAHDAEVARRLGTDCILMSTGHHSERRLAESKQPIMRSLEAFAAALI
jgi:phosphoglycolate phosphatase